LYRRAIGLIICILIISAISSSVIGTKLVENTNNVVFYNRDILYVGGSGPNNYSKIQYAIDDASDGDTVFVFEGKYYEQIYINTTINLIGENKATTVINGSKIGNVITVNAGYVNINGFKIEKSDRYGNGVEVKSYNCNISDNIFDDNGYGIKTTDTNNHTFTGNTFQNQAERCIRIDNSHNNTISDNYFIDTPGAISITYSNYSIISDNLLNWNYFNIGTGWCYYLEITNNIIVGKGRRAGIDLYYSDYCNISGNSVGNCDWGLWLEYSKYNNVYGNEFTNCDYDGIFFYQRAKFNVVSNNIVSGNEDCGINIWDVSDNNTIYCNTISSNTYGIYIKFDTNCNNNIIYHNNLIDNNQNGLDGCSNNWNIDYPFGGNYWDDYTGDDKNRSQNQDIPGSDGIGDTEHNLPGGGGNKDYYPLMYPWGKQKPVANYTYFEEYGGYVFNASTSYDRDGEVLYYEWDFGDGTIDNGIVVSHAFNDSGEYDVILTITDDEGYNGNHTKAIDVVKNNPPDTPTIDGPDSGKWGKPYYFTFQSSDIEGSEIWYYIDWGDGTPTSWMGPYVSGYELSDAHTWGTQDSYVVRCKAKDVYGIQSDWAEHEITIPRTRASSYLWFLERFPMLQRLLNIIF